MPYQLKKNHRAEFREETLSLTCTHTTQTHTHIRTNGKDMRREDSERLAIVLANPVGRVKLWHLSVRVDSKQDVGHIGLSAAHTQINKTTGIGRGGLARQQENSEMQCFTLHHVESPLCVCQCHRMLYGPLTVNQLQITRTI